MIIELLDIKKIAVENPGYYNSKSLFIDCDYINVDKYGFSALEFAKSCAKVGLITSFSQFPLGIKMPLERKVELVNILNKNDKIIIEDSFDSSFRNNGYQTTPLFNMSDKVIYLESFSRTIYPGLCISFMVLPNWLLNDFYNHFKNISSSISTFDQQLAYEYIEKGYYNRHINKLRTSFLNKKKLIEKNLDNDLFEIYSNLNYSSILVKIKKDINIQLFKQELVNQKIKINFLSDFCKNNEYKNILIIGFSNIDDSNLILALDIIKKILRKI
jgi:GntR family transcriptional regulator/MocR family aminotransferase